MSISIREYRPADLDRCRQLWGSLVQRHRDIYEDPTIGGANPGLELDGYLERPDLHRLWVRPVGRNFEAIRFFHREGFRLLGRFELSIALEAALPFGSARRIEIHDLEFDY